MYTKKLYRNLHKQSLPTKHTRTSFKNDSKWHRNTSHRTHTRHLQRYSHSDFKKTQNWPWKINHTYLQTHQNLEIDIVWADRVEIEAAEMDEMWSFIHDKSHHVGFGGLLTTTPR